MKKLATLLLAAGMVVSSFAGASAAEFKPSAQFINQFTFGSTGHSDLGDFNGGKLPNFEARTRIQLGFDYIASENLSATFLMRVQEYYGTGEFDSQWSGNAGKGDNGGILVRLAYVDWAIPSTDVTVRMGYQPVSLPAFAFGSNVVNARGSGITVNAPINDNIAVTALWTRIGSDSGNTYDKDGNADLFAIVGDFNYDGFRIAPWVAYASAGRDVSGTGDFKNGFNGPIVVSTDAFGNNTYETTRYKTSMWMLGASFELSMFDPFSFALDAYYSNVSQDGYSATKGDRDADGFFIGAAFSYKTDYATPTLKAWYASGSDERDANDDDFMGVAYLAPCFGATSIMFDNYPMADDYTELANGGSASGLWGIMLDVSDISFLENLSHQFIIAYMEGTNDLNNGGKNGGTSLDKLGKDDSVIEVNFNTTYQIYKNLSTTLQLGWLAPNFELDSHDNKLNEDILRAALSFTYKF